MNNKIPGYIPRNLHFAKVVVLLVLIVIFFLISFRGTNDTAVLLDFNLTSLSLLIPALISLSGLDSNTTGTIQLLLAY